MLNRNHKGAGDCTNLLPGECSGICAGAVGNVLWMLCSRSSD